jgi:hypothetical protein
VAQRLAQFATSAKADSIRTATSWPTSTSAPPQPSSASTTTRRAGRRPGSASACTTSATPRRRALSRSSHSACQCPTRFDETVPGLGAQRRAPRVVEHGPSRLCTRERRKSRTLSSPTGRDCADRCGPGRCCVAPWAFVSTQPGQRTDAIQCISHEYESANIGNTIGTSAESARPCHRAIPARSAWIMELAGAHHVCCDVAELAVRVLAGDPQHVECLGGRDAVALDQDADRNADLAAGL